MNLRSEIRRFGLIVRVSGMLPPRDVSLGFTDYSPVFILVFAQQIRKLWSGKESRAQQIYLDLTATLEATQGQI